MTEEEKAVEIANSFMSHMNQFAGNVAYQAALIMASWKEEQLINKACEWWDQELREVKYSTYAETLDAFRKAMED